MYQLFLGECMIYDNYDEGYAYLAGAIIEAVLYDFYITSDQHRKSYLLQWFTTSYGNTICELAGVDPDQIKNRMEVYKNESAKTNKRYDGKRIKKIYRKTH